MASRPRSALPSAESLRAVAAPSDTPAVAVPKIDYGPAAAAGKALAAGVQSLAKGIGDIADAAYVEQSRAEQNDAEKRLIEFRLQTERDFDEYSRSMPPGGAGFSEGWERIYEQRARQFFGKGGANFSPAMRDKVDTQLVRLNETFSNRARSQQQSEIDRSEVDWYKTSVANMESAVKLDPDSFETNVRDLDAVLSTSRLSPAQQASVRQQAREKLIRSRIEGLIERGRGDEAAQIAREYDTSQAQRIRAGVPNRAAIAGAAQRLGARPEHLAAVISYETGGTFDPNKWGGKGGNYLGLIQFGPEERRKYGVRPGMSFDEQMVAVEGFLRDRGFKPGMGLAEMYSIINAGSLDKNGQPRWNASDGNGTVRDHVARIEREHLPRVSDMGAAERRGEQPSDGTPLVRGAMSELAEKLITKAATEQAVAAHKASAAQTEHYERQLIDAVAGIGNLPDRAAIESDRTLTEPHRNAILRQHDAATAEIRKFEGFRAKFLDPNGGAFNPFDTDDRKAVDTIFRQMGGDETALRAAVDRTGILPESVGKALRGHLVSGSEVRVKGALNVIANLQARHPTIFTQVEGGSELETAAVTFRHYVDDLGMTPDEAAKRYAASRTPEYQARVTAQIKSEDLNKIVKDSVTIGDIESAFDPGVFKIGSATVPAPFGMAPNPRVGFTPEMRKSMLGDFEELFREHYIKNGDVNLSKKLSLEQLRKVWGVSEVTGKATVMRYPPERAPVYQGIDDVSGKIAQQAIEAIKAETGQDIPRDKLVFAPTLGGETAQAFVGGQPVPYQLAWFDKNGVLHVPRRAFVADPAAMRAATTEQRRVAMDRAVRARKMREDAASVTPPTLQQYGFQ